MILSPGSLAGGWESLDGSPDFYIFRDSSGDYRLLAYSPADIVPFNPIEPGDLKKMIATVDSGRSWRDPTRRSGSWRRRSSRQRKALIFSERCVL